MGKRRKNKRNKRQKQYNKKQFIGIFCNNCALCLDNNRNPSFCYQEGYRLNSAGFFKAHKNLLRAKQWLHVRDETAEDMNMSRFEAIFCENLCPEEPNCELLHTCYSLFQDQIKGNGPKQPGKRKKKTKEKLIFESYPTVFTNDNEAWIKKIEEIFADGSDNRQQDKAEESST